ncbi:hypothetical protein DMC30DRAFT_215274, partial [Rhodotorula diobovata]
WCTSPAHSLLSLSLYRSQECTSLDLRCQGLVHDSLRLVVTTVPSALPPPDLRRPFDHLRLDRLRGTLFSQLSPLPPSSPCLLRSLRPYDYDHDWHGQHSPIPTCQAPKRRRQPFSERDNNHDDGDDDDDPLAPDQPGGEWSCDSDRRCHGRRRRGGGADDGCQHAAAQPDHPPDVARYARRRDDPVRRRACCDDPCSRKLDRDFVCQHGAAEQRPPRRSDPARLQHRHPDRPQHGRGRRRRRTDRRHCRLLRSHANDQHAVALPLELVPVAQRLVDAQLDVLDPLDHVVSLSPLCARRVGREQQRQQRQRRPQQGRHRRDRRRLRPGRARAPCAVGPPRAQVPRAPPRASHRGRRSGHDGSHGTVRRPERRRRLVVGVPHRSGWRRRPGAHDVPGPLAPLSSLPRAARRNLHVCPSVPFPLFLGVDVDTPRPFLIPLADPPLRAFSSVSVPLPCPIPQRRRAAALLPLLLVPILDLSRTRMPAVLFRPHKCERLLHCSHSAHSAATARLSKPPLHVPRGAREQ